MVQRKKRERTLSKTEGKKTRATIEEWAINDDTQRIVL